MVWLVGLGMYYLAPEGHRSLGEPWTRYSPLQAFGFLWLVAGTMTYVRGDLASAGQGEEGEEEEEDRESGPMALT